MTSINHNYEERSTASDIDIDKISLLEEKLQVTRQKKKIGEVVVSKKIETRIINIPIKREKLVIERVGQNPELLTEIVTSEEKICGFGYEELENTENLHLTRSRFLELQKVREILAAIENLGTTDRVKIRIEIANSDSQTQEKYQTICDLTEKEILKERLE